MKIQFIWDSRGCQESILSYDLTNSYVTFYQFGYHSCSSREHGNGDVNTGKIIIPNKKTKKNVLNVYKRTINARVYSILSGFKSQKRL